MFRVRETRSGIAELMLALRNHAAQTVDRRRREK